MAEAADARGHPVPGAQPGRDRRVGLGVIVAMLLLAFNIDSIPLLGRPVARGRALGGGRPQARRRGADRRRQGRQGHGRRPRRRPRAGRLPGQPRHRARHRRPGAPSGSRRSSAQKYLALEPAGKGELAEARSRCRAPTPAYDVVRGVQRPRHDHRGDRHRPAGRGAGHHRRHLPGLPGRGAGRRRRAGPALPDHRLPRRRSCASCSTTPTASPASWPTATSEFVALLADGDLLLQELRKRRGGHPHAAGQHGRRSPTSSPAWCATTARRSGPALENLKQRRSRRCEANQANLDRSIRLLAPFVRVFANTLGNGRWFDTYVQNLVPVPGGPREPRHEPPCRSSPRALALRAGRRRSRSCSGRGRRQPARSRAVLRPRGRPLPGLRRARPRRQGRRGHQGHAAGRPGRVEMRVRRQVRRARRTPRPSSWRRRWSATATSS